MRRTPFANMQKKRLIPFIFNCLYMNYFFMGQQCEKLYLYRRARNAFRYKNGYNATKIGNATDNNIIYGKDIDEWNTDVLGNEVQSILENKKTYLLFYHHNRGIEGGLTVLRKYGTLTEVMNVYDTPLYYFERTR